MPIKRAAVRQLRKDRVRAVRNQAQASALKTLKKRIVSLLDQQKLDEARALLPLIMQRFDQAATRGILHKNTASRTKSRLMRQLNHPRPKRVTARASAASKASPIAPAAPQAPSAPTAPGQS